MGFLKDQDYFVICECRSEEHLIRLLYDQEDKEITMNTFLCPRYYWYERIWVAIKYIFGYRCRWGHWDSFIFSKLAVDSLQDFINKYYDDHKFKSNGAG